MTYYEKSQQLFYFYNRCSSYIKIIDAGKQYLVNGIEGNFIIDFIRVLD